MDSFGIRIPEVNSAFTDGFDILVTRNAELSRQLQHLRAFAKCDATVLITGETGTGKELAARALHQLSARVGKNFVPVNCGAMPVDLIENEFFGHEPQAFTGASSRRLGLVSEAEGGTLFLDEIDSAPLPFQAKLLRFLQDHEFRLVGSTKLCHANVRVIAAANSDLASAIATGKLREDLYHRLNVLRLNLPALRERLEDINLLVEHFIRKYSTSFRKPVHRISDAAAQMLSSYHWPGNVRELESVITRAVVLCQQQKLLPAHFDLPLKMRGCDASFRTLKAAAIAQFERGYLTRLLREHNGNITRAARAAGKHRRALAQLIRKHGITINRGSGKPDISITPQDNLIPPES